MTQETQEQLEIFENKWKTYGDERYEQVKSDNTRLQYQIDDIKRIVEKALAEERERIVNEIGKMEEISYEKYCGDSCIGKLFDDIITLIQSTNPTQ